MTIEKLNELYEEFLTEFTKDLSAIDTARFSYELFVVQNIHKFLWILIDAEEDIEMIDLQELFDDLKKIEGNMFFAFFLTIAGLAEYGETRFEDFSLDGLEAITGIIVGTCLNIQGENELLN